MNRHTGRLRRESLNSWQFELLLWGISSGFPLAGHFDLPGSQFIFGISRDPPMCTHTSLSKMDFTEEAYGWRTSPGITRLWPPGEPFLLMCVVREVS